MNYKTVAEGVEERSGRLYIKFRYKGKTVSERYRKASPANLKAAIRKRSRILDEITEGTFDYLEHFPDGKRTDLFTEKKCQDTIKERLEAWLVGHKSFVAASTYRTYSIMIRNHILPHLGNCLVKDVSVSQMKAFAKKLADNQCKKKTIREVFIPLRQMLDDAVAEMVIPTNPIKAVKLNKIHTVDAIKEVDDIDPFTCREIELIIQTLEGQARNFFQFAFATGMRTSELVALQWDDVDWNRKPYPIIRVKRAKVLREIKANKTQAGTRDVTLFPRALEALQAQKEYTFMQLKGDRYIFHNPRTRAPWVSDKAPRESFWMPALRRAGIRYRYPYQCRHTLISHMLINNVPITRIAKMVGHANVGMIIKNYSRWIEAEADHEHYPYWEYLNDEGLNIVEKKLKTKQTGENGQ